jgi:hypothetical protein
VNEDKIIALIAVKMPVDLTGSVANSRDVSNLIENARRYITAQAAKHYEPIISDVADEFCVQCDPDKISWIKETMDYLAKEYGSFDVYCGIGDTMLETKEAADAARATRINGQIEIYHYMSKSEMLDQSINVLDHVQKNQKQLEAIKTTHPLIYVSVCKLVEAAANKVKSEKERLGIEGNLKEEIEKFQNIEKVNGMIGKHVESLNKDDNDKLGQLMDYLSELKQNEYANCIKVSKEHWVDHKSLLKVLRMCEDE